ncbi:Arc family DNA-binding protein [Nocardia sp. NPDC057668]|uniref:FitA-like ribbon-helix-helix domain-containing protein n=1 Tax=Nocardia sp. NPDC057668 TaxID=3346202 RepID=UPI00366B6BA2
MKSVVVRNLSEEVHRAIKQRAAAHGRSAEAELRQIITDAVLPPGRIKLGSLLVDIGREVELTDAEHAVFDNRDRTPAEPLEFE